MLGKLTNQPRQTFSYARRHAASCQQNDLCKSRACIPCERYMKISPQPNPALQLAEFLSTEALGLRRYLISRVHSHSRRTRTDWAI